MYMKARTTYTLNYIDAVSFGGKKGAKRGRISNGIITYVSKCDNVPKLGLYRVHACVWVRAWVVLARARVSSHAFSTSLAVDSLAHIMENTRTPKQLATITATANCIHKATIILCVFRSGHLHPLHHLLPLVFSPYARIRVFVPYFCGFRFSFLFVFFFHLRALVHLCSCLRHFFHNSFSLSKSLVIPSIFSLSIRVSDHSNHICMRSTIAHVHKRIIHCSFSSSSICSLDHWSCVYVIVSENILSVENQRVDKR